MGHSEDVEQVACAAPCDDRAAHQMSRVWELVAGERWDEALPLCEAVVRNAPDLPGIFQVLGDVRANLKMWEPAARSYLDAIARDPDNAILFQKLGDLSAVAAMSMELRNRTGVQPTWGETPRTGRTAHV